MNANFAVRLLIGVRKLDDNTLSATALTILDDGAILGARGGLLASLAIFVAVVKLEVSILRGRDVHCIDGHSLLL